MSTYQEFGKGPNIRVLMDVENGPFSKGVQGIVDNQTYLGRPNKGNRWLFDWMRKVNLPLADGTNHTFIVRETKLPYVQLEDAEADQRTENAFLELSKGFVDAHNPPYLGEVWLTLDRMITKPTDVFPELRNVQLASIMLTQAFGIHPMRISDRWAWVVRPWAKIEIDPRQEAAERYFGEDNKYYLPFVDAKTRGIKVISEEILRELNTDVPFLRPSGLTGLQYLDHHRVMAAQQAKIPIEVRFSNYPSFN